MFDTQNPETAAAQPLPRDRRLHDKTDDNRHIDGSRLRADIGLLLPSEAAALLGLKDRTLDQWRAEARGPDFIRAGGRVFYRMRDIADWLELNLVITRRAS